MLREIRRAVRLYVNDKVTVDITPPVPDTGSAINPEEDFTFSLIVRNADNVNGGIPLIDLVWCVEVIDERIGKIYVPSPAIVRTDLGDNAPILSPQTLVRKMYIYPLDSDPNKKIGIGGTRQMALKGRAGSKIQGVKVTDIKFKVFASVDMEWIFPKNEDSHSAHEPLTVEG